MEGLDDANKRDLVECNRDVRKRKCNHFWAKVIKLLEATQPSSGNCLVDMNRVTYEVMAAYLSSLKTDKDKYKGMITYDRAMSSIIHLMKLDNAYPNHKYKEKVCNLLKGF